MNDTLFHGIFPPLLTPLSDLDTIDFQGLENLVERLLSGGVSGLFVLGTTGEGPSLSYSLRHDLIRETLRLVDGRVPILVGVTDTSMIETLSLADFAAKNGAAAAVLAAPYYHPIDQADLLKYLEDIAPRLPLPTFLYNMPSHTKIGFSIETLRGAFEIPTYIGLKDSSADMDYFRRASELIRPNKRLSLLLGPEILLPEALEIGADGAICGGAHLLPRLFVRIMEAHEKNDAALMTKCKKRLDDLDQVYKTGGFLKAMKASMSILGLCANRFAEPLHPLSDDEVKTIRQTLERVGIDRSTLE